MSLKGMHNIEGSDGLPLGVFGVGHRVSDDVLEERSEDRSGFLVDERTDSLDSTSSGESSDGGLGYSLDVVTENLPVPLGSSLAQSLTSLTTARHPAVEDQSLLKKVIKLISL